FSCVSGAFFKASIVSKQTISASSTLPCVPSELPRDNIGTLIVSFPFLICSDSAPRFHLGTITGCSQTVSAPASFKACTAQFLALASPVLPLRRCPIFLHRYSRF